MKGSDLEQFLVGMLAKKKKYFQDKQICERHYTEMGHTVSWHRPWVEFAALSSDE